MYLVKYMVPITDFPAYQLYWDRGRVVPSAGHTFLLPISTLFNREGGLPVSAQQEKYKALIWLRKWESNPLLLAYETSEMPYLPSAIVFFQDYK